MIDGSIAPPMFGYNPAPADANTTAPGTRTGDQWGSMLIVGPRSIIAAQIAGTYDVYRQIRRHPTVAIAMTGIRALLKAADWTVEVDDDVPDEVTELIEETFIRRKNTLLNDVFTALEFGFSGFEKIWGKTEDGYTTIVDMKPLLADLTAPVIDLNGTVVGLDNQGTRLGLMKSWLFTFGGEARNPWGESLYENIRETAWRAWNDTAKKFEQYTTKAAGVVPIIKAAMGRGRDENAAERDINEQMEDVLEHLGDGKGVIWPIWCPEWMQRLLLAQPSLAEVLLPEIKLLEVAPGHGTEFVETLGYWDKLLVRGLLFPERALLEGVHGNKADATSHGGTAVTNIMQILGEILEFMSRGCVNDVLDANWPRRFKDKVRLMAVALDAEEVAAFRALFDKMIANPMSFELATRVVELDSVVDGARYPKRAQVLNPIGETDDEAEQPMLPAGQVGTGSSVPAGESVAKQSLNGIQITSLRELVMAVIDDQLPELTAKTIAYNSFPAIDRAEIDRIFDSVRGFEPEDETPTAPAGPPDAKGQALAMATMYKRVCKALMLAAHKFSSTQIEAPEDIAADVLELGRAIPDEDLADDGRETRPHVTVRYGLHTADPAEVAKVLAGTGPITAKLGPAKVFPPTEGHAFDVVVLSVESDGLRALNEKLGALENTNKYPEYTPHMTIAYVKPGKGQALADGVNGLGVAEDREFTVDAVTFSDQAGKETVLKLGK